MNKIRALSLMSLIVCISAFSFGFSNFSPESAETIKATWPWGLLLLAGSYGTIAAVSIVLLSFLALRASPDNSFIVKKKSLYGRMFLFCAGLEDKYDFSICQAFRRTNAVLFIISICIGVVVILILALIQSGLKSILIGLGALLCFAILITVLDLLHEKAEKTFDKLEIKRPRIADAIRLSPAFLMFALLTWIIGMIVYELYTIGMAAIWAWLAVWVPWLAMWATVIGLSVAGCFGIYKLAAALFGKEFSSFYHKNLCPKIKIE